MGSVKHRCGQSPAGPDPVDPRPGPAPADRRADPVPDESWAEYRLVIRSGEYEYCSEWTRDYDTVLGWDIDSAVAEENEEARQKVVAFLNEHTEPDPERPGLLRITGPFPSGEEEVERAAAVAGNQEEETA